MNTPSIATQTAHIDPRAAGANQEPLGLEQKAQWLEQELVRLQETRAIAPEPRSNAEERNTISARIPGELESHAIKHEVGSIDTVHEEPIGDPDPIDRASAPRTQRRRSFEPARGRSRMPEVNSLFSEIAEAPRVPWREVTAGVSAVLLVLAIALGGYFYYVEKLAPNVAADVRDEPESAVPSRETRTADVSQASVASALPLTKGTPETLHAEQNPNAPPVKVAGDLAETGEGTIRPTAISQEARAADAAESSSDEVTDAKCPPAVVAIALCDWLKSHADGK
ncbi:MAG: hypothetical protein WCE38_05365 [Burkholderiales bacterium]